MLDRITLQTQTPTTATRANMAAGTHTYGTATSSRALVTEQTADDINTDTADRTQRTLQIWVPDDTTVAAGMLCTMIAVDGDSTLAGKSGTVLEVERDALRASRRFTIRLGNDR